MVLADLGKPIVLSQEAIPGVNRIGAPGDRRRNDVGDIEIAAVARRLADTDRLVG